MEIEMEASITATDKDRDGVVVKWLAFIADLKKQGYKVTLEVLRINQEEQEK